MSAMHPTCPSCGTDRAPLLWGVDTVDALTRVYRCPACGKRWSVDGRQESLFEPVDLVDSEQPAQAALFMED